MLERLTADEVLRRYANGERDFRNVNLRGVSFAKAVKRAKRNGQVVDLSGADFSGAQIQGTNFAGVKLQGANFTAVKTGISKFIFILNIINSHILFILIGSVSALIIAFLDGFIEIIDLLEMILLILVTGVVISARFSLPRSIRNFTTSIICVAVFLIYYSFYQGVFESLVGLFISLSIAILLFFAFWLCIGFFYSLTKNFLYSGLSVLYWISGFYVTSELFIFWYEREAVNHRYSLIERIIFEGFLSGQKLDHIRLFIYFPILLACAFMITFVIANWRDDSRRVVLFHKSNFIFYFLDQQIQIISIIGGTSFYDAILEQANFYKASIKNTDFYRACLSQTRFRGVETFMQNRVSGSILQNSRVLSLIIKGRSSKSNFSGMNLRGAYLAGANLTEANLTRADLSEAMLENAELVKANLKEAAAIGTNFTKAHLTGACLEAWNIDSSTILKDVDCQFVFLLEQPNEFGHRERRPHDSNKIFSDGEFEQFFKEVLDEVQILIKNGIQPEAFRSAMQRLMAEHNITTEDITAYQRKGNDVQVSFKVPPGTDKGAVERTWDDGYQAGLAAAAEQLKLEQKRADDVKDLALETIRNIGNLTFNVTAMNQSNNPNITTGNSSFVNTGSMDGNTVNLGTISGNVTTAINQLPDQPSSDQPSLKDLLTELQAAIEAEPELSTDDKAEALEQVKTLAEAGQKPEDSRLQKAAKTAMKILRGTTAGISETTKLAEAAAKLLPAITAILAFL